MEKVLLFWQKLHYNVYKFNCFTQIYVFGLPITLLLKNKYMIKQYEKRGVKNPGDIVRRVTTSPSVGVTNWTTDGSMILLIALIAFSILNFIAAIAGYMIWAGWTFFIFFIIAGLPSVFINYFVLWKDDKYLVYYKEFAKQSKQEKRKWAWISFITVLLIIGLLVLSFIVMTDSLTKNLSREEKINLILEQEEYRLYKGRKDAYDDKIEERLEQIEDSLYRLPPSWREQK